MSRRPRRSSTVVLIACYVALSGWLFYQGTSHSLAHHHHSAATHANPLCTWQCSASQVAHDSHAVLTFCFTPVVSADTRPAHVTVTPATLPTYSRGPPHFTLS